MEDNTIYIIYSGNDKYRNALQMSVLSLAMTNRSRPIHIFFLTGDFIDVNENYTSLTLRHASEMIAYCKKFNHHMSYDVIDMKEYLGDFFVKNKNYKSSYTPYAMLRLLVDKIKGMPDRLLHLDGDTVIMGLIDELYDTDLTGKDFAMVQDAVGHHYFGKRYCNSGVMLFNLVEIKKNNSLEKVRVFLKKHCLFMPDQSSLNFTCKKERKLILPRKFNEQKDIREDTVIRHYCKVLHWLPYPHTTNIKPWNLDEFRKVYGDTSKELLAEYEAMQADIAHKQEIYDFFNK